MRPLTSGAILISVTLTMAMMGCGRAGRSAKNAIAPAAATSRTPMPARRSFEEVLGGMGRHPASQIRSKHRDHIEHKAKRDQGNPIARDLDQLGAHLVDAHYAVDRSL